MNFFSGYFGFVTSVSFYHCTIIFILYVRSSCQGHPLTHLKYRPHYIPVFFIVSHLFLCDVTINAKIFSILLGVATISSEMYCVFIQSPYLHINMVVSNKLRLPSKYYYFFLLLIIRGRDSSVSITTGYGLDGPGIESRWGRDISHKSSQTGPGVHPASCTMCTGSFPGVKRPGSGADHPPPSSAEVTNE
jgi:hypothetical protein